MIQVNELRIGNWLYVSGNTIDTYQTSKPKQVTIEFLNAIKVENEERPDGFLTWFNPIPLTTEILEKCGFKRHTYEMSGCKVWYLQDTSWRVAQSYRDENEYKLWHERVSPPTWNLKTLNYLHELQNLIFSLTGEELTFKP